MPGGGAGGGDLNAGPPGGRREGPVAHLPAGQVRQLRASGQTASSRPTGTRVYPLHCTVTPVQKYKGTVVRWYSRIQIQAYTNNTVMYMH